MDDSGNCYVTGYSTTPKDGLDIVTIKYSPSLSQIWLSRYNGPASYDDSPAAVLVDSKGSVYVAGTSSGTDSGPDYITVKYNSKGEQVWNARYNGPGNADDEATALALDDFGNIFVTGASQTANGDYDFLTVKYDSNGTLQWAAQYDGTNHSEDWANSIAVDHYGNVYVAGYSASVLDSTDIRLIQYSPDGQEQWVERFKDFGNTWPTGNGLKIDSDQNLYLVGYSLGVNNVRHAMLLKCNSSGTEQWTVTYGDTLSYPQSIRLTRNNEICVFGSSGSNGYNKFLIDKFNGNGVKLWETKYVSGDASDDPSGSDVSSSGDLFLSGTSSTTAGTGFLTMKCDSSGDIQWISRTTEDGNTCICTGIVADKNGGAIVMGERDQGLGTGVDYFLLSYSRSGAQESSASYDGIGNTSDECIGHISDWRGNTFAYGVSGSGSTGADFITVKYDSNGNQQWVKYFNSGTNRNDYAIGAAVDSMGGVAVVGYTPGNPGQQFIDLVKYGPSGDLEWVDLYNGAFSLNDVPVGVEADKAGNVYMVGTSNISNPSEAITVTKFDTAGNSLWSNSTPGNASGFAIDGLGNVYVTGRVNSDSRLELFNREVFEGRHPIVAVNLCALNLQYAGWYRD